MKITVDTSHDSHDDIRKVIKMLQHLVGDSQEIFTNQPSQEAAASPVANIFGDVSAFSGNSQTAQETQETQKDEDSESTEDLFAELFSEEELKKMEPLKEPEDEDEEEELSSKLKSKDKKYGVEFY